MFWFADGSRESAADFNSPIEPGVAFCRCIVFLRCATKIFLLRSHWLSFIPPWKVTCALPPILLYPVNIFNFARWGDDYMVMIVITISRLCKRGPWHLIGLFSVRYQMVFICTFPRSCLLVTLRSYARFRDRYLVGTLISNSLGNWEEIIFIGDFLSVIYFFGTSQRY